MLLISEITDNKTKEDKGTTGPQDHNRTKEVKTDTSSISRHQSEKSALNNFDSNTNSTKSTSPCACEASTKQCSMGKTTEGGGIYTVGEDEREQQQAQDKPNLDVPGQIMADKDVDGVTSAMKVCTLSVSSCKDVEDDIVKHLEDLNLRENESKEEPIKAVLKPEESDERGSEYDDDKESCYDNNELNENEDLVRLEEPSFEAGSGNTDRSGSEGEEEVLERGGPDGGIPAQYQYNHHGLNYSGLPYPQMPASFPNYSNFNNNSNFNNSAGCAKRTIDQQEVMFECEPYKYTRAQQQQQQLQQQQQQEMLNNLNNPGCGLAKQVVYQKQMSGGTVYTNDNLPPATEPTVSFNNFDVQKQQPQLECQNTLDLLDLGCSTLPNLSVDDINLVTGEATEVDDPTLFAGHERRQQQQQQLPPVATLLGVPTMPLNSGQSANMLMSNFVPQQQQPQQPIFTGSNRTSHSSSGDDLGFIGDKPDSSLDIENIDCSLLNKFLDSDSKRLTEEDDPTLIPFADVSGQPDPTFPPLSSVEMLIGGSTLQQTSPNRSSYGSNEDDNGYNSEMSPQHEMDRSPAGSSHGLASSPPRSNLSMATLDSGVGSPMSEDGSIQGKSPRHISNCSPIQAGPFSPAGPQTQIRPQVFLQQQKQQQPALPQAGQLNLMAPYNISTGVTPPLQQPFVPQVPLQQQAPLATASVPSLQDLLANCDEGYHCNYLDDKNQELSDALAILDKDLERQIRAHRVGGTLIQTSGGQKFVLAPGQGTPKDLPVCQTPQVPNLPTTVPVTISAADTRQMAIPGKQKDSVPVAPQQQAFGHNFVANSTTPKLPLPRLRKPNQQPQRQQQLQQVVLVNGSNILFPMMVSAAAATPKPRFPSIAPKPQGMAAPMGATAVNSCNNGLVVRHPQNSRNVQGPITPAAAAAVVPRPVAASPNFDPAALPPPGARIPDGQNDDIGLVESIGTTVLNRSRRILSGWTTEKILEADDEGDKCLHTAVSKSMAPLVIAILERLDRENVLAEVNTQNNLGQTALYIAASTNQYKLVKLFIDYKADVNLFAVNHSPSGVVIKLAAIHCVCLKGEELLPTLKSLLSSPAINVDLVNSDGHTALHCAIVSHGKVNSIPIVQALMRAGANPDFQVQQSGKTALMLALEYRHMDLLEAMCQLIEPAKLAAFFKTQAFDGSNWLKIAKSLKPSLDLQAQQRLAACFKLAIPATIHSNSNYHQQQQQQQQQQLPGLPSSSNSNTGNLHSNKFIQSSPVRLQEN